VRSRGTPIIDPAAESAQDRVIACFRDNPQRPLDCWREVEEFKSTLKQVQREFIDISSRI
jgi:altered-inheritance-of-mitochondria protein 13